MNKKIAIQGIESSFHEEAAYKYFGENIETVKCLSFQDLCTSLKKDESDFAVMAIENSIAGSLLQNYTLLQEYNFNIIGEIFQDFFLKCFGFLNDFFYFLIILDPFLKAFEFTPENFQISVKSSRPEGPPTPIF